VKKTKIISILAVLTLCAGSDALQGGSGGNASADTNYYNMADAKGTITAAVSTSPPSAITAPAATQQVQKGK